jgi:hypothetical protein
VHPLTTRSERTRKVIVASGIQPIFAAGKPHPIAERRDSQLGIIVRMAHSIFFSWQADRPTEFNRNFIERALSLAKDKLTEDLTVEPSLRDASFFVDRDTKDVPGSPPIVETIFNKIDSACAFVADLTFVGKREDGRPTSNPNVLVEYGWALKSRAFSRIILVMNTAYGQPSDETLPFNLKHVRHPITYHLPEDADDAAKQTARSDLVRILKNALGAIINSADFKASIPKPPEAPKFVEAKAVDGPARFRKRGEAIGVLDDPMRLSTRREVILADAPALWLRVMPEQEQSRQWTIAALRDAMKPAERTISPIGNFHGLWSIRTPEGYGKIPAMHNDSDPVPAVVVAFKSGEVWSVYAGPLSRNQEMPNVESFYVECFVRYVPFLRDGLKISPPYRWIAGIEGLKGKTMQRFAAPGHSFLNPMSGECLVETIVDEGLFQAADKPQLALTPFFEQLHDAFGSDRLDHYDAALLKQFPD